MLSWQIWQRAILRVARATEESLEAQIIELFAFQVIADYDDSLNKVCFCCPSEYVCKTFYPYCKRVISELEDLLGTNNLRFTLEVRSARDIELLQKNSLTHQNLSMKSLPNFVTRVDRSKKAALRNNPSSMGTDNSVAQNQSQPKLITNIEPDSGYELYDDSVFAAGTTLNELVRDMKPYQVHPSQSLQGGAECSFTYSYAEVASSEHNEVSSQGAIESDGVASAADSSPFVPKKRAKRRTKAEMKAYRAQQRALAKEKRSQLNATQEFFNFYFQIVSEQVRQQRSLSDKEFVWDNIDFKYTKQVNPITNEATLVPCACIIDNNDSGFPCDFTGRPLTMHEVLALVRGAFNVVRAYLGAPVARKIFKNQYSQLKKANEQLDTRYLGDLVYQYFDVNAINKFLESKGLKNVPTQSIGIAKELIERFVLDEEAASREAIDNSEAFDKSVFASLYPVELFDYCDLVNTDEIFVEVKFKEVVPGHFSNIYVAPKPKKKISLNELVDKCKAQIDRKLTEQETQALVNFIKEYKTASRVQKRALLRILAETKAQAEAEILADSNAKEQARLARAEEEELVPVVTKVFNDIFGDQDQTEAERILAKTKSNSDELYYNCSAEIVKRLDVCGSGIGVALGSKKGVCITTEQGSDSFVSEFTDFQELKGDARATAPFNVLDHSKARIIKRNPSHISIKAVNGTANNKTNVVSQQPKVVQSQVAATSNDDIGFIPAYGQDKDLSKEEFISLLLSTSKDPANRDASHDPWGAPKHFSSESKAHEQKHTPLFIALNNSESFIKLRNSQVAQNENYIDSSVACAAKAQQSPEIMAEDTAGNNTALFNDANNANNDKSASNTNNFNGVESMPVWQENIALAKYRKAMSSTYDERRAKELPIAPVDYHDGLGPDDISPLWDDTPSAPSSVETQNKVTFNILDFLDWIPANKADKEERLNSIREGQTGRIPAVETSSNAAASKNNSNEEQFTEFENELFVSTNSNRIPLFSFDDDLDENDPEIQKALAEELEYELARDAAIILDANNESSESVATKVESSENVDLVSAIAVNTDLESTALESEDNCVETAVVNKAENAEELAARATKAEATDKTSKSQVVYQNHDLWYGLVQDNMSDVLAEIERDCAQSAKNAVVQVNQASAQKLEAQYAVPAKQNNAVVSQTGNEQIIEPVVNLVQQQDILSVPCVGPQIIPQHVVASKLEELSYVVEQECHICAYPNTPIKVQMNLKEHSKALSNRVVELRKLAANIYAQKQELNSDQFDSLSKLFYQIQGESESLRVHKDQIRAEALGEANIKSAPNKNAFNQNMCSNMASQQGYLVNQAQAQGQMIMPNMAASQQMPSQAQLPSSHSHGYVANNHQGQMIMAGIKPNQVSDGQMQYAYHDITDVHDVGSTLESSGDHVRRKQLGEFGVQSGLIVPSPSASSSKFEGHINLGSLFSAEDAEQAFELLDKQRVAQFANIADDDPALEEQGKIIMSNVIRETYKQKGRTISGNSSLPLPKGVLNKLSASPVHGDRASIVRSTTPKELLPPPAMHRQNGQTNNGPMSLEQLAQGRNMSESLATNESNNGGLPPGMRPHCTIVDGKPDNTPMWEEMPLPSGQNNAQEQNSKSSSKVEDHSSLCPSREVNPNKRFETFVTDKESLKVVSAALDVCNRMGTYEYKCPLFVFGESGVGKSHLLSAIYNRVQEEHPNLKIALVRGEEFIQHYVSTIADMQKTRFSDRQVYFQKSFTDNDLLIFDDIQALTKGEKSRKVFFEIVESFLEKPGHQLVLTANLATLNDLGFKEELTSRISSGVCMELYAPQNTRRRDVIEAKCAELGLEMSLETLEFLSIHLSSNIRDIEGALRTIKAMVIAPNADSLTFDELVRNLSSFIVNRTDVLPLETIISFVTDEFKVTFEDLCSSCKKQSVSLPRAVACSLARDYIPSLSLNDLARVFKKDHSSIYEAIVRTRARLMGDYDLKVRIQRIAASLDKVLGKGL